MASPIDMNLSKLWEIVKDRQAWSAAGNGVATSQAMKLVLKHGFYMYSM